MISSDRHRSPKGFVCLLVFWLCACLAMPSLAWAAGADSSTPAPSEPSTARIHVLSFGNTDAILLESDGRFGLVDAGEDDDYPSGTDPRYPLRDSITRGGGVTNKLFAYMKAMGVTSENFEFLICTHPHSDHIGGADEVIEEFKPQRVYLMPYKDSYIFEPSRLWDNRYVYDQAVAAALFNGATLIQGFDEKAPVDPARIDQDLEDLEPAEPSDPADLSESAEPEGLTTSDASTSAVAPSTPEAAEKHPSAPVAGEPIVLDAQEMVESVAPAAAPETVQDEEGSGSGMPEVVSPAPEGVKGSYVGNPQFKLGSMDITIKNYSTDYFTDPKYDANEFSLGVVVEANNHRAFLAGDISNLDGDEDRLAKEVGKVEFLKMGHHGLEGSNTRAYLNALSPRTLVMTSLLSSRVPPQDVLDYLEESHSQLIDAVHQAELNRAATVADFSQTKVSYNVTDTHEVRYVWRQNSPHYVRFEDGYLKDATEWNHASWGDWYHFEDSPYAQERTWYREGVHIFYFKDDGTMTKDGVAAIDGATYLFDSQGHMMGLPYGWSFSQGAWRYGLGNGTVKTGWLKEGNAWYYLKPESGAMAVGWENVNGTYYYFTPGSGVMKTGWLNVGGAWYYLTGSGAMATGWLFDGAWYYLKPESGAMATGWAQIGNSWYYLNGSGAMKTGWLKLGSTWYYLDPSGAMAQGWINLGGTWYYLRPGSGAMAIGWTLVDNTWYYLSSSGAMKTGWLKLGSTWYYLNGSGAMATGWLKLGNTQYYLEPSGAMATGTRILGNTTYRFSDSGAWIA